MKIESTSVPDAARDPLHPDHERWVKDRTLKMEIEHAKRVGIPLRVAEAENARLLERSARLANNAPPAKINRSSRTERAAARGVTKRAAQPIKVPRRPPCNWCGVCRNCSREKRVMQIIQQRSRDPYLADLARTLFSVAMRLGKFRHISDADHGRAVVAAAESACDASVARLGKWFR